MAATDHGTASTYTNHKCRCPACRAAWAEAVQGARERRHRGMLSGLLDPPHGTDNTYTNYMCRCNPCRAARAKVKAAAKSAA
jgi:hypothetical protein